MTFAGFNRRMRKTARPVVWKGYGVQLPVPPSDPWECGWRLGRAVWLRPPGLGLNSPARWASAP